MGWCLDCHRNPEEYLVPQGEVTDLIWVEQEWMSKPVEDRVHNGMTAQMLVDELRDSPPQHCAACHY
jgi:hypothetical protein